jgi:uncharacterized protein
VPQRNYRDPLHNIISLNEAVPEDRLLVELIDAAEFQRLRRIKQLGIALFTYQGAEHSRFTHSLGVMHLMTRVLGLLSLNHRIDAEALVVGRVGALLHDLGHGPFSHVIEKVFGFHHEDWTRRIILDERTEVNSVLRGFNPALPVLVASLYDHSYTPDFVSQLVSSQLDCDRMDYLLRDSLMTGAKYGIYDLEWVIRALRIDERSDRIYVEWKGLYAVEEYLQARYYMFRQVYFHRTLRAAEAVLMSTLKRARELMRTGKLGSLAGESPFERLLVGEAIDVCEYLQLDDVDLMFRLKCWSRHSDRVLSDLSKRFIDRRLFKAMDLNLERDRFEEFQRRAAEILEQRGFDAEYYMIMDRAADVPYYGYYRPEGIDPRSLIYIETQGPDPAIKEISEVSEVVKALRGYRIDRVCFPAEVSGDMGELINQFLGGSLNAGLNSRGRD